jgi:hypothetical protein
MSYNYSSPGFYAMTKINSTISSAMVIINADSTNYYVGGSGVIENGDSNNY